MNEPEYGELLQTIRRLLPKLYGDFRWVVGLVAAEALTVDGLIELIFFWDDTHGFLGTLGWFICMFWVLSVALFLLGLLGAFVHGMYMTIRDRKKQ